MPYAKRPFPRVTLKRERRRRLEQGHPWVFRTEVARVEGDPAPGDLVDVVNHEGVFLAHGFINPLAPQILVRILTYDPAEAVDEGFFLRRIREALRYRERLFGDLHAARIVFGEADFLPGLVVDKFADVLSVQILAYGMEVRKEYIRGALVELLRPRGIYLRNDVPVRAVEGLPLETGVWYGEVPERVEIREHGLRFLVDVQSGHKTGYFLDQRENRAAIAPFMRGPDGEGAEVLDCFSHTGAFAVHAAHFGARRVLAVDVSEASLALARENARINGVDGRVEFRRANCFDELRRLEAEGARFDVVILDPPAFAKHRRALEGALRGYKEINLRALRLLRDGGFLITASCSQPVSRETFLATILAAAQDARKLLRLVEFRTAARDHPVLLGAEETNYLKFAVFEVRNRGA
ncbi:class I SAM-dependent rRNA methyltransferase [Brockia lithotrophica]|uniref:23S rRNA (Cytosine1962-C5)-methyltransferase n=1 Tax=Brockia lithotrophica TaxID=933949 RepID=A0A660L6V7_9BACL|nr:class I SAM-dependent rRNA methyltransferase [Brockia lithotrophica]RKQ88569.1 23S rRNA (cytosine1962-C5)-methyltransferase [Brockia lithotrophica]